jgi:NAD(P)-dependent dehydrogenase (short-subunit alcohol dehydrogenase family)
MSLNDKVLLMSGAGPGLGRTTALLAAARGASLALLARTSATLEATAALAVETQGLCVTADVADPQAVRATVDATLDRFGRIDVLVHSILPPHLLKPVLELDEADLPAWRYSLTLFDEQQSVNQRATFLLMREGVRLMRAAGVSGATRL